MYIMGRHGLNNKAVFGKFNEDREDKRVAISQFYKFLYVDTSLFLLFHDASFFFCHPFPFANPTNAQL